MPYITEEDKKKYEPALQNLRKLLNKNMSKGDLTYLVYSLGLEYISKKGESYTNISSAISCLDDAKEELRRRRLTPYEENKIKENGDVK